MKGSSNMTVGQTFVLYVTDMGSNTGTPHGPLSAPGVTPQHKARPSHDHRPLFFKNQNPMPPQERRNFANSKHSLQNYIFFKLPQQFYFKKLKVGAGTTVQLGRCLLVPVQLTWVRPPASDVFPGTQQDWSLKPIRIDL